MKLLHFGITNNRILVIPRNQLNFCGGFIKKPAGRKRKYSEIDKRQRHVEHQKNNRGKKRE